MTEEMTIHRALAELKLIDARIEKKIQDLEPTGIMQKDKKVNNLHDKKQFEEEVKGKMKSIEDLIVRRQKIKSGIVRANSVTMVDIGVKSMTIADAISFKTVIAIKKNLASSLKTHHRKAVGLFNTENEKMRGIGEENARIWLGQLGAMQSGEAAKKNVTDFLEPWIERNEYHLVDPIEVEKAVEEIETEIGTFESEVDATLSEINAITKITI